MKKIILFAALLFSGFSVAQAQLAKTDNVNLTVKLNAFQSLIVNSGQKNILLEYKDATDFSKGVSSEVQTDHLTVVAAGGFVVNVKADDLKSGVNTIEASTIKIQAAKGTKELAGVSYPEISLKNTDQALITTSTGGTGTGKTFNVTYKGADKDAYVVKHINGEAPTVYTTVVTYTIAAK